MRTAEKEELRHDGYQSKAEVRQTYRNKEGSVENGGRVRSDGGRYEEGIREIGSRWVFGGEWREYEVMNGANEEGKKEERGRKEEAWKGQECKKKPKDRRKGKTG